MQERIVWREVYQSSPAAVILRSNAEFQEYAERMQLPPDFAENLRARSVAGTLRLRIPVSGRGSAIQLRLSNEEGAVPLVIGSATAGVSGASLELKLVTFGGAAAITIPPGSPALSDPIHLSGEDAADLVLSFYLPEPVVLGGLGQCGAVIAPGDQTLARELAAATPLVVRPFVTAVSSRVPAAAACGVIAALGDSLTDANCSPWPSWPQLMQGRLTARTPELQRFVSNAGIGGNRLLAPGLTPEMGIAGLARLERDVLRIEGLSHIIVFIGINDIGLAGTSQIGNGPPLRAADLIVGYRQIISRARSRGAQAVFATLLPFAGSSHYTAENENARQVANAWIRSSGEPDAVIDFEAAVRDPDVPTVLRGVYDLGDHLHVTEAGAQALADAIDLSIFDTAMSQIA